MKKFFPILILLPFAVVVVFMYLRGGTVEPREGGNWRDKQEECKPTGCSGEICSDEDVVTTCVFRPEFACYKTARCERQKDLKCGWTETPELLNCLEQARSNML